MTRIPRGARPGRTVARGGALLALGLALAAAAPQARAGTAGFYFESASTIESRRLRKPFTMARKTWVTDAKLRFDDGDELSILVDLDAGSVAIVSKVTNTYVRQNLKNIGGALLELGSTMARHVSARVVRTSHVKEIGGKPCRQCRVELAGVPCSVWVQDDSRDAFNAVRSLARSATRKMGGTRSALVTAFGGLGGLPREFAIGDPKQLEFTWTVTRAEAQDISNRVFDLPAGAREDAGQKAVVYTLQENVYFYGEATAGYFATTPAQRDRSLMPQGMSITDPAKLEAFYKGREGAERHGIFWWTKPLLFHLAPELWCFPLSGRSVTALLDIGVSLRDGGLKYYPMLEKIKMPAN